METVRRYRIFGTYGSETLLQAGIKRLGSYEYDYDIDIVDGIYGSYNVYTLWYEYDTLVKNIWS